MKKVANIKKEFTPKPVIPKPELNWREIQDPTFDINDVMRTQEECKAKYQIN
jgi:hypothetical protein